MTLRVVIADDTPDLRLLLRLALDGDDFHVVGEAGDGEEAVRVVAELQPDVVTLDLAMPLLDGLQAIPRLRAVAPHCRILVVSGFESPRMGPQAERVGADAYVEKGAAPTRIADELRRLCGLPARPPSESRPAGAGLVDDLLDQLVVVPFPSENGGTPDERSSDFVSGVVHELMTPITVLQGFASALERSLDHMPPDLVRTAASRICRGADQLRALVEALAEARDIAVGEVDLDPRPVDLAELVQETVTGLAGVTADHELRLDLAARPTVDADPTRLRQVLTNLVGNAAKFAPRGTPIDVTVGASGPVALVGVRDRGPGVPPADRQRIFDRYSRLDSGAKGLGLGLFISRGIARAHGGELTVRDAAGGGAEFVLRLPQATGGS